MATNYLQLTATRPISHAVGRGHSRGLIDRLLRRLGQLICGITGHDAILHFEERRMCLRCTSCGYDSPGWDLGEGSPRLLYHGVAERHILQTPVRTAIAARPGPVALAHKKSA